MCRNSSRTRTASGTCTKAGSLSLKFMAQNPRCVIFTKLPEGVEVREETDHRVAFDGYFFKRYRYQAGDGWRECASFHRTDLDGCGVAVGNRWQPFFYRHACDWLRRLNRRHGGDSARPGLVVLPGRPPASRCASGKAAGSRIWTRLAAQSTSLTWANWICVTLVPRLCLAAIKLQGRALGAAHSQAEPGNE